jgi:hypothetical protein
MSFPWLERTPPRRDGSARRAKVAVVEVADRAAIFFRLGYTVEAATKRLCARVAWEFDPPSKTGHHRRPGGLSDQAVAKIVQDTYARKPR